MQSLCSVSLTSHQRKILRKLLAKENKIIDQCRKYRGYFADIMMHMQCVNHYHNMEERTLKCGEFICKAKQLCQSIEDDDIAVHNMDPQAIQTALTCDCICIQAACFRILYKWLPELDNLRMKRLKVKTLCSESVIHGLELCAKIEHIAQKIIARNP